MKLKIFSVFVLFFLSLTASAQQYSYRHYTVIDGLAQNQVTALYQDQQGFVWVGTKDGVSRFDGRIFRNYSQSQGLNCPWVNGFLEVRGQFMVYGNGGIWMLKANHFEKAGGLPNVQVSKIVLNQDSSEAYLLTTHELFRFNRHGLSRIFIMNEQEYMVDMILLPRRQGLLLSTSNRIIECDPALHIRQQLPAQSPLLARVRDRIFFMLSSLYPQPPGVDGVYAYCKGKASRIWQPASKEVRSVSLYATDRNLVTTSEIDTWVMFDALGQIQACDSIKDVPINRLLIDRENNLFLGTENGLWYLPTRAFRNWGKESGMAPYVWSIVQTHDSTLWFAGYKGQISRLKSGTLTSLPDASYQRHPGSQFYMGGRVSSRGVWINPMDSGFVLIRNNDFRYISLLREPYPPCGFCVFEDTVHNEFLYGASEGLWRINARTYERQEIPLPHENVLWIEQDGTGNIWIFTSKAVYWWDQDQLKPLPGKAAALGKRGAVSAVRDARGNMWIARRDAVYLFNGSVEFQVLPEHCFFLSNYQQKYILAGGIKGLYLFDIEALYARRKPFVRFFDRHNGFNGIECGQNGNCLDYQGNVWIPTSESVVQFMPNELRTNPWPPALYLRQLEVATDDLNWKSFTDKVSASNEIVLSPDLRNLRIVFSGISHTCPDRIRYKTRMVGYDEEWSHPTSLRSVTYTNLPPKEYRFEVLACNSDGVWAKSPLQIAITIEPYFYETLWFTGLLAMGIAGLLVIIFLTLLKRHKRKEVERQHVQRELVSLQIRTINAQLDPHFVFNTLTAIGADIQENKPDQAYEYFVKVSNLLRSSINGNVGITRPLKDEMEFVENYLLLQKYRFGEKFSYTLMVNEGVDVGVLIPKMCIQIFVENALKHGLEHKQGLGLLKVDVSRDAGLLRIRVEDNGVGREQSQRLRTRSNGRGLQVFAQFFDILNKYNAIAAGYTITDLYDDSGRPIGTRVDLWIPDDYRYAV